MSKLLSDCCNAGTIPHCVTCGEPCTVHPAAPDDAAPKSILIGRGTKLCPQCERVEAVCKGEPRKEGDETCATQQSIPVPIAEPESAKITDGIAGVASSGAPTFDPEAAPTPSDSASETPLTDAAVKRAKALRFILIEHGEAGEPKRLTAFRTNAERETATLDAIFGEHEPVTPEMRRTMAVLYGDRVIHFEGDPSVEWIDAYVVNAEAEQRP